MITPINSNNPPKTINTLPALETAYKCAKTALLSRTGFAALAESFDDKIEQVHVEAALKMTKIYVVKWRNSDRVAFHVPDEKRPGGIVPGNAVLHFDVSRCYHSLLRCPAMLIAPCAQCGIKDVQYFLPRGLPNAWTMPEQQRVVLIAWYLIHDLSHAVGSSLANENEVTNARTPPHATGFLKHGISNIKYVAWDEAGYIYGDRGWFVEDRLGGKVSLYVSQQNLTWTQRT